MRRTRTLVYTALFTALAASGCSTDYGDTAATGSAGDVAGPGKSSRSGYYLTGDGDVITPFGTFPDLRSWYASREFKAQPRCGSHAEPQDPTKSNELGDLGPMALPEHCTLSFTNIEQEYALSDLNLVIPVVFHNIVRTDNVGFIPDDQLLAQIEVLNEDFGMLEGTPGDGGPLSNDVHIRFVLAGINRVQNDAWFDDGELYENDYKSALGWDPQTFLNIYTVGLMEGLGWAAFPQEDAGDAANDGIVLLFDSVGRGFGDPPYNQGRTGTHEVGHYLGLMHTFSPNHGISGICENGWNAGDLIQDTPEQEEATFGCPAQFQSCGYDLPSTGGNIHNYMDYTDDTCMFYFTIQQANRAVCGLVNYRAGLYRDVPATYNVDSYIKTTPPGSGTIHNTARPVPAGTEIVLEALPVVPSNQPVPAWNARLRLSRKPVGQTEWELVDIDFSSGLTSAKITHPVPEDAFYQWSVTHEEGGAPGPYTANITYLNCYDPGEPNGTKDIPECQP